MIVYDNMAKALQDSIEKVGKEWKKAKRKADKEDRILRGKLDKLRHKKPPKEKKEKFVSIKSAAFEAMETAYNKASDNGRLYANARQIMYAARPYILEQSSKCKDNEGKLTSNYFQRLLKDYLEEYNPKWKIIWDARGHIIEPHTGVSIGLGGLEVMQYIRSWVWGDSFDIYPEYSSPTDVETRGPKNRFNNVLFIEKEGFYEILQDAGIQQRYDVAIMSTKGLPVKAACDLIEGFDKKGVNVYVLHDFDLAGFKIMKTLREGTRLAKGTDVHELGFRFEDIKGLQDEEVTYKQEKNPKEYLYLCGATEEEANFLVDHKDGKKWSGRRVELNAMTSPQLIEWLQRKFEEKGIKKFIPDEKIIKNAYKRALFLQSIEKEFQKIVDEFKNKEIEIPKFTELKFKIEERFEEYPDTCWDSAIWKIANDGLCKN